MSVHRVASGTLRPLSLIRTILAAAAVLAAVPALPDPAMGLSARVRFDEADVRLAPGVTGTHVSMDGMLRTGGDGTPELPMAVRVFRIPDGFEVAAVHATPVDEVRVASGIRLAVREEAVGERDPANARRAYPAGALVDGASTLPAEYAVGLGSGDMAGYQLHSVAVFPLRWEPSTGNLLLATAMDLSLDLVPSTRTPDLVRERHNPEAERAFAEAVHAIVANPQDVTMPALQSQPADRMQSSAGFAPLDLPSVDGSAVDMVIVTTDAMAAAFQTLADWKTQKGVPAVVRTTQWIDANYPLGNDRAERVRMFLQDAYAKWGTYLLLVGGDFDKVVPRLAFNRFFFQGTDIPTDQYFACLNGNWNADGDELIGEGLYQGSNNDQVDLYPELFVGRASVDNATEAQTFVNKSFTYDRTPPANYVKKICYLAEVLFPQDWEYGQPPEIVTLDGADLTDEFDLIVPPSWTRTKRYQINNTLDRSTALAELSGGHHHLMTLMNHGDAFKFSTGNGLNPLVYRADSDSLSNGDYLMFLMATACNPNQIDLECQGESFMNNPNGGAIAVIGPTREDFPLSASNYHKAMLSLVFDQGITRFGMFSQVHRVPFVPLSQTDATPDRWTMMTKELLGDPDLRFWTEEPQPLLASHASNVTLGATSVAVTVTDTLSSPVADALVCVSDANGTYARGRTDAAGMVTLPLSSSQTGTIDVVASSPNFKPSETTVTVDAAAGAVLALTGFTIDDDATGNSNGNGDGTIDAGETVELDLTMHNGGGTTATGVSVTASIEAGSNATFDLLWDGVRDASKVFIGPDRVNPGAVPFTLDFATPAIDYIGAPFVTFAMDSTTGDQGIFLWQDLEGWHLRWGSGTNTIPVTGVVSTDGRVRGVFTPHLEVATDTAAISAGQDSLSVAGTTGSMDLFDGVDFALSDNTMLTMTSPVVALGDIGASASAGGKVAFSVSPTARDLQIAYVDFETTSALRATWSDEVAVAISGPELEAIVLTVEDGAVPPVSGDGDGVVEVGETVRLTPSVLNRGSGFAGAVTGSATAASGISFVDPSDAYGDIAHLAQTAGTDGYVFTVNDSTGTAIDLTLTDSLGRTWVKSIDFMAPAAPDSMDFESSSDMILVFWDPSPEADAAGYNIYRSATSGSGHVKQNSDLIRNGSRYEDAGLALGSAFYYYATAVDSSGNEGAASSEVYGYTTQVQVPGWPQTAGGNIFSSIAIADADNSGNDEVYVGSHDFKFYGFASDGSALPDFPLDDANAAIWCTPALADLDGDGDLEILYGSSDNRLYVVHHDGTPVFPPNPWVLDLGIGNQLFRGAVSVGDVDNDNELEFFAGTDGGTIYAFNHDGTGLVDSTGLFYGPMGPGSQTGPLVWGPVAMADWDGNGTVELAFACWNDSLYVVNADGTDFPGFPKGHGRQHKNGPVFADLDNDNHMELIVGCSDSAIYAYKDDGTGYLGGSPVFATLPDQVISMPAPCQLDADPELELVVTCFDGNLYVFNHDGSGFLQPGGLFAEIDEPAEDTHITSSPIVVDVDGDGSFEIFFGHRNHFFYGFHSDGSTVVGMPIALPKEVFSTAAAGDLDHDGDVDVAFASYDTNVYVLDFAGASTAAAYEWPTYGGNNMRQNAYGSVDNVTAVSPLPGVNFPFALSQNSPNPFGAATSIRYSVPRDMAVSLRIYNVEGRLVRTLVNGAVNAGPGTAEWDGRDTSGARLSSGVYFYRMQAGDKAATRKSLLLR
ncbi:FG-GAP-like repeat-containing protein [bacterium]|nr:FG-GAP-like repeat-containing protein [bacterium]